MFQSLREDYENPLLECIQVKQITKLKERMEESMKFTDLMAVELQKVFMDLMEENAALRQQRRPSPPGLDKLNISQSMGPKLLPEVAQLSDTMQANMKPGRRQRSQRYL